MSARVEWTGGQVLVLASPCPEAPRMSGDELDLLENEKPMKVRGRGKGRHV